jgi:glycosyltransferase involved in cell wall biosynthesis
MKLSVVIPVYNERGTLNEIPGRVASVEISKEIVLVDDCSTDGSRAILEEIQAKGLRGAGVVLKGNSATEVRVVFQDHNQGKGAALRRGFAEATGDAVIVQDADLEYDPNDFLKLVQPIQEGTADVVFGSRFATATGWNRYGWHALGNQGLTLISNLFTNLALTDMETCYKAFRADVLREIRVEEDRFGFEPEVTAKIARKGLRVFEVPISYHGRGYAEGKKIGMRDLVRAIYAIIKYGLRPGG